MSTPLWLTIFDFLGDFFMCVIAYLICSYLEIL